MDVLPSSIQNAFLLLTEILSIEHLIERDLEIQVISGGIHKQELEN